MEWTPTPPEVRAGETVYEINSRQPMTIERVDEAAGKAFCVGPPDKDGKRIKQWVPVRWILQGCSKTIPPSRHGKKKIYEQFTFPMEVEVVERRRGHYS